MATSAKWFQFHILILLILALLLNLTAGIRTSSKMYIDLQTQNACFRVLNATHQVGCSSSSGGNVGVLHYVETDHDFSWVLSDGPNPPYVVLMHSVHFNSTNVDALIASGRVTGILVINLNNETFSPGPSEFSADKSCPNDAYGMYHNNSEFRDCKQQVWNTAGTGMLFKDYSIPMFSLPNVTDVESLIYKCFDKFNRPINGVTRSYPLCAVQLSVRMDAAKDSVTCIRRSTRITNLSTPSSYCDPLGDDNIVATVKAVNSTEERANKSVVVLATKMDSFSMFYNEYPSADATVTGIVTSLAVAHALRSVLDEIRSSSTSKDIMFAFFQGESFDYIGSSRMVYDMEKGVFPQTPVKGTVTLKQINQANIHSFIEISQLGLQDAGSLWVHTDPVTRSKLPDPVQVSGMIAELKSIGSGLGVEISEANSGKPLPPASVQRFLMKSGIPALVLTDHGQEFTNKFYNSRFDLPEAINVTEHHMGSQTEALVKLATTLARFIYFLATGQTPPPSIQASQDTVHDLLQCFLYNPQCELFQQSVDPKDADSLSRAKKPFPLYVSVYSHINQVTTLTRSLLAQYLGSEVNETKNNCSPPDVRGDDEKTSSQSKIQTYQYLWLQGSLSSDNTTRKGMCIESTTLLTQAKSPAFDIEGYNWESGVYSTWTESVWDPIKVRIFLVPSPQFKTTTLSLGVIITLVSFLIVYFFHSQSDIIFAQSSSQRYYTY